MPPELEIHAMANARVIDLAQFQRMKERGDNQAKVQRWLGLPAMTVKLLWAGQHWQQKPEKIAEFNEYRGTRIPVDGPEMGCPPEDVLKQYGGARGNAKVERTPGEQFMVDAAKRSGVSPEIAEDIAKTIDLMAGTAKMPNERLDTLYFQEEVEKKLALALQSLSMTKIAHASVGDLSKLISMLVEKRALLRGEPTQIVSHRDRASMDKVIPLLLAAAARRGVTLDLTPRAIEGSGE